MFMQLRFFGLVIQTNTVRRNIPQIIAFLRYLKYDKKLDTEMDVNQLFCVLLFEHCCKLTISTFWFYFI